MNLVLRDVHQQALHSFTGALNRVIDTTNPSSIFGNVLEARDKCMLTWLKEHTQKAVENALRLYRPPRESRKTPLKRTRSAGDITEQPSAARAMRSADIARQPPALQLPMLTTRHKRSDEQEPTTDELDPGIRTDTAATTGELEHSSRAANAEANTTTFLTPQSTGVPTPVKTMATELETEMDQRQLSFDNFASNLSPVTRNNSQDSPSSHHDDEDKEAISSLNASLDRRQRKYGDSSWDSLDQTGIDDSSDKQSKNAGVHEDAESSDSSGLPEQDTAATSSIAAFVKSNRRETPSKTEGATVGQTATTSKASRSMQPRKLAPVFKPDKKRK
jgi:hypothetical protein